MEVWQNSQRLENRCDYSNIQKRRLQAMYKLQWDIYHSSVCSGKYMSNALKGNVEK